MGPERDPCLLERPGQNHPVPRINFGFMGGQQCSPMSDPQASLLSLHRFNNCICGGVSKPSLPPDFSGDSSPTLPPAREKVSLCCLPNTGPKAQCSKSTSSFYRPDLTPRMIFNSYLSLGTGTQLVTTRRRPLLVMAFTLIPLSTAVRLSWVSDLSGRSGGRGPRLE